VSFIYNNQRQANHHNFIFSDNCKPVLLDDSIKSKLDFKIKLSLGHDEAKGSQTHYDYYQLLPVRPPQLFRSQISVWAPLRGAGLKDVSTRGVGAQGAGAQGAEARGAGARALGSGPLRRSAQGAGRLSTGNVRCFKFKSATTERFVELNVNSRGANECVFKFESRGADKSVYLKFDSNGAC
jgi:hypothetical protein